MCLVHFDICCYTRTMPCSYKIFHAPWSLFHGASWISSLISKLNLLLGFLLMNPWACLSTVPQHISQTKWQKLSSFIWCTQPAYYKAPLISHISLQWRYSGYKWDSVYIWLRVDDGGVGVGWVRNEIIAIKSDPYAGVFWVCVVV